MDYRKEKEILNRMLANGEIDQKEAEDRIAECDRKLDEEKDIFSEALKELFS